MKRMLFAGAVALAAATPAFAADLYRPVAPPPQAPAAYMPPAPPVYNWGGIYIGINGGYGFGDTDWEPAAPGVATGDFSIDGPLVGGTIGANFQSGQFVFGVEGDWDWADLSGSTTNTTTCFGTSCTFQTSDDWLATLRGRVGYAFDRVLLYGTAGGAGGDIKSTLTPAGGTAISSTSTEYGWTAGAGVEFAITDNITAKAEYLFVDLSNGSFGCSAAACSGTTTAVPVTFDASLIRAGLNYKFNGF
jgi:outer membrane immunogenic protein